MNEPYELLDACTLYNDMLRLSCKSSSFRYSVQFLANTFTFLIFSAYRTWSHEFHQFSQRMETPRRLIWSPQLHIPSQIMVWNTCRIHVIFAFGILQNICNIQISILYQNILLICVIFTPIFTREYDGICPFSCSVLKYWTKVPKY